MNDLSEKLFGWIASNLPETEASWVEDMQLESRHVPQGLKRLSFTLGCLRACLAVLLKLYWGVRRVGQTLLGLAVLSFCVGAFVMTQIHLEPVARVPVYALLASYTAGGVLILTRLDWAKQFSLIAGTALFGAWLVLFLPFFDSSSYYLKALLIEAAMIMGLLHVAASFVDWSGEGARV